MANKIHPCIYRILNTVNGKVYIGSAMRPTKRWRDHYKLLHQGLHHSRHLQGAWKTYGPAAFMFEIIEDVAAADLIEAEQRYLDALRPYDPAIGYNISPTAGSTFGIPCSPEKAAKIGVANRGKVRSEEHREALNWTGRRHSDEFKEARRQFNLANGIKPSRQAIDLGCEARRGKPLSEEHRSGISTSLQESEKRKAYEQRQRRLTDQQVSEMKQLRASGWGYKKIGARFSVSAMTARDWILR